MRASRGFTLVEVVIAIGLATVAFVSVLGLLATGLNMEREAEEAVAASNLITRLVSEKRNNPLSSSGLLPPLDSGASGQLFLTRGVESVLSTDPRAAYQVNYTITPIQPAVSGDAARVSLLSLSLSAPANSLNAMERYHVVSYIILR